MFILRKKIAKQHNSEVCSKESSRYFILYYLYLDVILFSTASASRCTYPRMQPDSYKHFNKVTDDLKNLQGLFLIFVFVNCQILMSVSRESMIAIEMRTVLTLPEATSVCAAVPSPEAAKHAQVRFLITRLPFISPCFHASAFLALAGHLPIFFFQLNLKFPSASAIHFR